MKIKLLFICIAALAMIFALAVGVSASTIYKDDQGNTMFSFETNDSKVITSYTGEFPKNRCKR